MNIEINELLDEGFSTYSEYVNYHRAIPHFYDGLKPVHRRIMYACYMNKWFSNKPLVKVARIVGETMGKLHSHGDTSISGALVHMAQPHVSDNPLIEGEGNYGSLDAPAAAMRYIEAKLSAHGDKFFDTIDKDCVEWTDNYDNTILEPVYLAAPYPQILVHPTLGIGVGMSSSIPSHNLNEVIDATKFVLQNPEATTDEIIKKALKGPDFPSGCNIVNQEEINKIYGSGSGTFRLRANFKWEGNVLIINNFPYGVAASKVENELIKLQEKAEFIEIKEIINSTQKEQELRIVLRKQDDEIIKKLCWETSVEKTFSMKLRALKNDKAVIFSLKDLLYTWGEQYLSVLKKEFEFDFKKLSHRKEQLEGIVRAMSIIDEVVALIKESSNRKEAKEKLIKIEFTEVQANYILDLKLVRLVNTEILSIEKELEEIKIKLSELDSLIKNRENRVELAVSRLNSNKNNNNRKSKLTNNVHKKPKKVESTTFYAREKNGVVLVTDKYSKDAFAGDKQSPVHCVLMDNTVMPISSPSDATGKGILVKSDEDIIHVSTDGLVKRTKVSEIKTSRKAKATGQTEIHSIFQGTGWLVFTGADGEKIQFSTDEIKPTGRSAKGVIGVKGKFTKVELVEKPIQGVKEKRRHKFQ